MVGLAVFGLLLSLFVLKIVLVSNRQPPSPTHVSQPTLNPNQSIMATPTTRPTPVPAPDMQRLRVLLDVPFLVQAPYAHWDALHEEACEEASLLNVAYFLQKRIPTNKDAGEKEIQDLVKYETDHGYKVDVTLQQLGQIAKDYYGFTPRVETTISINKIKQELNAGRPVIVGAAGKILSNPHFKNDGPNYHMLVIKGFDDTKSIDPKECRITAQATCSSVPGVFITNDVGIYQGNSFVYTYEDLLASIHNWDATDILNGQKASLILN